MKLIKKIKRFFNLQKMIQIEVLETLATICLYLEFDAGRRRYTEHMRFHSVKLKKLSAALREEMEVEEWRV